jgi:2-polyprenyl-3-methyl-5-hydroxy-6-metoxy-1,4-benzoquinol methylase
VNLFIFIDRAMPMPEINDIIKLPENYDLDFSENIYGIYTREFKQRLSVFTKRFSEIQENEKRNYLPFQLYEAFPDVDVPELTNEIYTRKQDLSFLKNQFFQPYLSPGKRVLEIGGWNSWLTHKLHRQSLQVVTADIFRDEYNGLGSKKHYKNGDWLSIQTDLLQTDVYRSKFDVIIFNHCLQFLTDPHLLLEAYRSLLHEKGILIILGAAFHKNTKAKEAAVLANRLFYKENYKFELQFYPSKGYFDNMDYKLFEEAGLSFLSYRFSFLGKLKKQYKGEKEGVLYFVKR